MRERLTAVKEPAAHYNPFCDEAFVDEVIADLLDHRGEWRHPGRLILDRRRGECDSTDLAIATYKAAEAARRVGFQIDGDTVLGYRLTGWKRVRFVRLAAVLQWPPAASDERSHRAAEQLPGQLSIAEAVG